MKRSTKITLQFVCAASLALLAGCSQQPERYTRRCADENGDLLPDSYCAGAGRGSWIYMGPNSTVVNNRPTQFVRSEPTSGTIVNSGGTVVRAAPPTARGGFGGSSARSGFFGG